MRDVVFYEEMGPKIRCLVCIRRCLLSEGSLGYCGNYMNSGGKLVNVGYGIISAHESRPIEIKPLFHFYPGSTAYTFSGFGCNFACPWCQNHHLSKIYPSAGLGHYIAPNAIVRYAELAGDQGLCASFNEPAIHLEYISGVFEIGRKKGFYNVMVSNGSYTREALDRLIDSGLDAVSLDIKGCVEAYRRFQAIPDPFEVLKNARYALSRGVHIESVFLVVTGANDSPECIKWVIDKHIEYLGVETPLHINRYHPAYRYWEKPTSMETLLFAYRYALERGVHYVYIGNILETRYMHTYCPSCGHAVLKRSHYGLIKADLTDRNRCSKCGYRIRVVGKIYV